MTDTPATPTERIKSIVSAALGLAALSVPGFAGLETALGGAEGIMSGVLGAYAAYQLIALAVNYVHGAVAGAGAVVIALLLPAPAMAQEPAPAPQFGALLSYDTAAGGVHGLSGELDGSLEGWPVSMVAHVGHGPQGVRGAVGPRLTHDFGPVSILWHYLYGAVGVGPNAATTALHRIGGALDVDIGRRGFVRWGVNRDHAGVASWSGVVGVGVRF